jgi:hypothetical protein
MMTTSAVRAMAGSLPRFGGEFGYRAPRAGHSDLGINGQRALLIVYLLGRVEQPGGSTPLTRREWEREHR